MQRLFIYMCTALCTVFLLHADVSAQNEAGWDVLLQDYSARQSAMAGTGTALSMDVMSLFCNPAAIAGNTRSYAGVTFINQVLDVNSGTLVFSTPVSPRYVVAAALRFTSYGSMDRADQFGTVDGTFSPGDYVLSVSVASNQLKNFTYGISLKGLYSRIDQYAASAAAVDAGCIYSIPSQSMTVGASLQNAGKTIDAFINEKESLPVSVRAGITKRLAHLPLMLLLDAVYPLYKTGDSDLFWSLAGEFTVSDNILLRWGYSSMGPGQNPQEDAGRIKGISLGLAIFVQEYRLDYGWRSRGILGNLHAVTLNIPFDIH